MSSVLVNHLIAVTPLPREGVWSANLQIIGGLVSIWGPGLTLSKMDLLHMLNKKDEMSRSYLSPADRFPATGTLSIRILESYMIVARFLVDICVLAALAVFAMLLKNNLPALHPTADADIPPDKYACLINISC